MHMLQMLLNIAMEINYNFKLLIILLFKIIFKYFNLLQIINQKYIETSYQIKKIKYGLKFIYILYIKIKIFILE